MSTENDSLLNQEQKLKNAKLKLECLEIATRMNVPYLIDDVRAILKEVKEEANG